MENKNILVVDLDGTLIKTDMFFETAWSVLSSNVKAAFGALKYMFSGRAALKQRLAASAEIDPGLLPYNETVLELIRDRRELGLLGFHLPVRSRATQPFHTSVWPDLAGQSSRGISRMTIVIADRVS